MFTSFTEKKSMVGQRTAAGVRMLPMIRFLPVFLLIFSTSALEVDSSLNRRIRHQHSQTSSPSSGVQELEDVLNRLGSNAEENHSIPATTSNSLLDSILQINRKRNHTKGVNNQEFEDLDDGDEMDGDEDFKKDETKRVVVHKRMSHPWANITREEYISAYAQYFKNVKKRKEKERLSNNDGPRRRSKNSETRVHTYLDSGTDVEANLKTFHFNISCGELTQENIRIRKAELQLPISCSLMNPVVPQVNRTQESATYDLTASVISWLFAPKQDPFYGVNVTCVPSTPSHIISFLRVVTKEFSTPTRNRSRRSTGKLSLQSFVTRPKGGVECSKTRRGKTCCRRSLKVSFADLGISDIVIEPQEFDAHICAGRCNAKRVSFSSVHAMLQQILHQTKGKGFAPRPCCTPTKLTELDVIHLDPTGTKLEVTVLKDAIVAECGCS